MKLVPVLLLNVVTVAVALVAYDALSGDPAPSAIPVGTAAADTGDIEQRLEALETERRRPRRPTGTDPQVLERLDALEATLGVPVGDDRLQAAAPPTGEATGPATVAAARADGFAEPTAAEIKRFRALREAVRRQDAVEKNKKRINAALDALPVHLTDGQRAQVHVAYAAFQPRVTEIWSEVKTEARRQYEAGVEVDRDELVSNTTAVIQNEFTEVLNAFVPQGDAASISSVLVGRGK